MLKKVKLLPSGFLYVWMILFVAYFVWTFFFLHWDTYPCAETGFYSEGIYVAWILFSMCLLLQFPFYMVHFLFDKGREKFDRIYALVTLIAGFVFITIYCFLKDPRQYTASMIGLEYPWAFKVWGILSTTSVFVNTLYMFRKFSYINRFGLFTGLIGCMALFVTINVPSAGEDLILNSLRCMSHWTGALLFAFGCAFPVLFFLLHMAFKSDNRRFVFVAVFFSVIFVLSVTLLITVGKNGLIEGIPVWSVYLILFLVNFTPLFPAPEDSQTQIEK